MQCKQHGSDMKLFAETRTKRNTACVVLLVWVFALASGVANACLLEWPGPHSTESTAVVVETGHPPVDLVALVGTSTGHDDKSDAGKESCLKVCDQGTHTLPTAYSSGDNADPGLAPWVVTLWTGSQERVSAPRRMMTATIPIVGLPVRVRYSRLAL